MREIYILFFIQIAYDFKIKRIFNDFKINAHDLMCPFNYRVLFSHLIEGKVAMGL